ncbi:hypothetical protein D7Y23_33250 [Corallococcus sp. AB050B]|nr:hypothetical protein D7Y23_33250 [Corallococcus sp. AB050B]
MTTKFKHMSEAWGLDGNPFPSEAVHTGQEPYDREVYAQEHAQFFEKLFFGALMDRRGFGFLWSKSPKGEDTGLGKTTLLRQGAKELNHDFGLSYLRNAGMKEDRAAANLSLAAYATLNTTSVSGIYPILFAAVEYLADPANGAEDRSLLDRLKDRIVQRHKLKAGDGAALRSALVNARRKLGATLPGLREDALDAFCAPQDGAFAAFVSEVSPTARARNGLQYFDFVFTVASAAGVPHLFVLVDQLEDLATSEYVPKAKRSKEVGRLRDIILEMPPFVGNVHFVFTFHVRAAAALMEMWAQNRLPSYDPEDRANGGCVVVLRGIHDVERARKLLVTYLAARRDGQVGDALAPFDEGALPVLLARSGGRPGILLQLAHRLFDVAAEENRERIDGAFASSILGTEGARPAAARSARAAEGRDARALEDLLK